MSRVQRSRRRYSSYTGISVAVTLQVAELNQLKNIFYIHVTYNVKLCDSTWIVQRPTPYALSFTPSVTAVVVSCIFECKFPFSLKWICMPCLAYLKNMLFAACGNVNGGLVQPAQPHDHYTYTTSRKPVYLYIATDKYLAIFQQNVFRGANWSPWKQGHNGWCTSTASYRYSFNGNCYWSGSKRRWLNVIWNNCTQYMSARGRWKPSGAE